MQSALLLFRISRAARVNSSYPVRLVGKLLCLVYLILVEWTWGIELPWATVVGPRLRIFHGTGLVVNAKSKIGADVTIRQGVCIGSRFLSDDCPHLGDRSEYGANAIVIGDISIGEDSKIGAGAVVLTDVPANRVAVGNPARLV